MQTIINKLENSNNLGIAIPEVIFKKINLQKGSIVDIKLDNNNQIIIQTKKSSETARSRKKLTLINLVNQITDQNKHQEIFTDHELNLQL